MTIQKRPYGKSTIAMSAYNAIAISNGKTDKATIFDILIRVQHPLLGIRLLERSLNKLVRKNFVKEENGVYSLYDSKRRVIVARDLSDTRVDNKGIPRGGWKHWRVRDFADGLIPIEEAIRDI